MYVNITNVDGSEPIEQLNQNKTETDQSWSIASLLVKTNHVYGICMQHLAVFDSLNSEWSVANLRVNSSIETSDNVLHDLFCSNTRCTVNYI